MSKLGLHFFQRWPPAGTNESNVAGFASKNESSVAPKKLQEPVQKMETVAPKVKEPDVEPRPQPHLQPTIPQAPIPAPVAFQSNRHSSEEEWETGKDDDDEVPVVTASRVISEPERQISDVRHEPLKTPQQQVMVEQKREEPTITAQTVTQDDLVERGRQDEEMALREQLAKEMEADELGTELEAAYSAIALYDYQAGEPLLLPHSRFPF